MDIKELELLLKDTKYETISNCIHHVELKGYKYDNLFKIGNDNTGYFSLKIRKNNEKYLSDSIENISKIIDKDNLVNKFNDIIEKDGLIIMLSDWLNGCQPIDGNREHLPSFFSLLAKFNKNNTLDKGQFTSMYVYGNYFDTIADLVNWEINYHKEYLKDIIETKETIEILNCLKNGLPCMILEDMNTGNLLITEDGKSKFIDTEWVINGLNLYQFEKIDYFGFDERQWYNINEEAKDCYIAYFETLGIKTQEANDQIRAFELLQVLRTNSSLKCHCDENYDEEEIRRRIKKVIEYKNFI